MNLAPLEFVSTREALGMPSTAIVSEFAGVAQLLEGSLLCNPHDSDGLSAVLETASGIAAGETTETQAERAKVSAARATRRTVTRPDELRLQHEKLSLVCSTCATALPRCYLCSATRHWCRPCSGTRCSRGGRPSHARSCACSGRWPYAAPWPRSRSRAWQLPVAHLHPCYMSPPCLCDFTTSKRFSH